MTLDQLEPGQIATIKKLNHDDPVRLGRLLEMGLIEDTEIEMIRRAPMGDPIEYRLEDYCLSLRIADAKLVEIERQ